MEAVVYTGPGNVAVEDIPKPEIEQPTDVILRMTSAAICGSDLHMYDGHTVAGPGVIIGHEPMGIVEAVGDAVRLVKSGDRVVVPFNIACGDCINCVRGMTSACLTLNPEGAGAAYGYVHLGPYKGAQAEYVRVPHGDWACLKLPGKPGDEFEDDFLMLADIFATAYYSCDLAKVEVGKSVAIFGAGPVGLLAALSAKLKGAGDTYVIDKDQKRLDMAKTTGAIPINFLDGDPVEQIMNERRSNRTRAEAMRPGEEKMTGVDCCIDAVGYQAFDRAHPDQFKPNQVLLDCARLVNPGGAIGVIGVYQPDDPAGRNEAEKHGMLTLPFGLLWSKGVSIGTGQTPVKSYHVFLRDLIMAGKARPGFIVTNHINIKDAPETYRAFDKRNGVVKAAIRFV